MKGGNEPRQVQASTGGKIDIWQVMQGACPAIRTIRIHAAIPCSRTILWCKIWQHEMLQLRMPDRLLVPFQRFRATPRRLLMHGVTYQMLDNILANMLKRH